MNPAVQLMLQLIPLLVLIGLYAAFAKLSALICRFTLSWAHSLLFALLLSAAVIATRAATFFSNITLPVPLALFLGVGTTLIMSGWFFRGRATRRDAQPLGVAGGLRLGMVLVVLMGGVAFVLLTILGNAGSLVQ